MPRITHYHPSLTLYAADSELFGSIALLVATHPHADHIRGIWELLDVFPDRIAEFWDPGYYHPSGADHRMMTGVERLPQLLYAQPTSGMKRWIGNVAITVLSPSIHLKNRFDTYGIEINDASISLRVEFPASRVVQRELIGRGRTTAPILGADAQTLSWAQTLTTSRSFTRRARPPRRRSRRRPAPTCSGRRSSRSPITARSTA